MSGKNGVSTGWVERALPRQMIKCEIDKGMARARRKLDHS